MAAPLMALQLTNTTSITTGAASAGTTIPFVLDGSGTTVAKVIRIAATAACWVKLGIGTQTAVAGSAGFLVQPGDAQVLLVAGNTHIGAIQAAAAGVLSIVAVENYV